MKLNNNFLNELFKCTLTSKNCLDIVTEHLKFEYLPNEQYKKIFERIKNIYSLEKIIPTFGSLSQHFNIDDEILKTLYDIQKSDIVDKQETVLVEFEEYIKKSRFVQLYNKIGNLYNEGKSQQAINSLIKESKAIEDFSLVKTQYDTVFQDFKDRQIERMKNFEEFKNIKIPFGIHELDYYTQGGMEYGSSVLLMARSGRGKSTMLRWLGLSAAQMGYKVVHFQFEGTKSEALTSYDSGWTGSSRYDIEQGILPEAKTVPVKKALSNITRGGGEIFVIEASSFDSLTIESCRSTVLDLEKIHGKVDLVIFDYLDIIKTGNSFDNSEKNERFRRLYIANKITDIAKNINCVTATATQSNDVKPEQFNNLNWLATRNNISDAKNIIYPFSYFITINQTDDEYENGVVRLYCDKLRKEKSGQVIQMYQNLALSRFYDAKKTCLVFWDNKENKKITRDDV